MDCSGKLASLNATAASAKGTQSCTGYFTGGSGGTTVGTSSCTGCGAWGTCSGGTCKATACKTGYYYSNGSCTLCSTVSVTNSGTENGTQESQEDCETQTITNGTKKRCRYRYRTPYRTYTTTCYRTGGAGGTNSSSSCTGSSNCSTTYGNWQTPSWGNYTEYGAWSYSCSSGYSVSGSSCACTTSCSTQNNRTSTQNGSESCTIANGTGSQTYINTCNGKYESGCYSANSSSCTGCTSWGRTSTGACTVQSCNTGYQISGNSCVCKTNCTSVKNTTDTKECTPSNTVANAKTTSCPKGKQTCTGTYTNNACQSAGAQCTGCSGYGECNTSCTAASCNAGYYLASGACNKCDDGYTSSDGNTENRNSCYKTCTVPCTQQACPANATCSHGSQTSSGTQYYGGVCNATPQSCSITITCKAGYYLSNGKCETCSTGKYCTGNNNETSCPTNYPNSVAGATKITDCYSNDKSRTWTGKQNDPTLPSGCSKMTTNACSKAACNYKMYSNSAGNGDGEFHSGCQTNNEACAKTIASVEASAGNYVNGTTCPTCTSANSTYPKSDGGAIGSGYCYREVTLTGKQNNPATLAGCSTRTLTDCKPSSCTYKDYYSANDTPCTPDDCTKTQTCTSADKNYYLDKGVAKTCSSFSPTYTKSDGGNITNAYCYQLVTKNGVQNEGRTPSGCASVTEWNSCTTKSCEYKDYYTAADETCTPTDCTKSAKSVMASAGSYVSGSICKTCPDKSYCPGGTYTLSSSDQGLNPCPTGADGSDSNRSALAHCYKNCPVKEISGGTTTKVSEKVQYTGTQYADCKYYVNCYAGYGAAGDGTTNPTCTQCPVGQFSAGVKNTCANCSNAPENSTYTSNSNTNNCSWSCNSGYGQTFQSKCVLKCTAGISTLHAGDKVSVQLYDTKSTTPSIVIQKGDKMCYGNLTTGSGTNALNVQYNNQNYHTVN